MKSYMLSTLAAQLAGSGVEAFRARHAHDWLVWEPGAWCPPTGSTLVGKKSLFESPKAGEALALALESNRAFQGEVVLGRGGGCSIVVNDGTLSHQHLTFTKTEDGKWRVRDSGSKNGSWVDGEKLIAGRSVPVRPGARIKAADVCLTFYDVEGLLGRLMEEP